MTGVQTCALPIGFPVTIRGPITSAVEDGLEKAGIGCERVSFNGLGARDTEELVADTEKKILDKLNSGGDERFCYLVEPNAMTRWQDYKSRFFVIGLPITPQAGLGVTWGEEPERRLRAHWETVVG